MSSPTLLAACLAALLLLGLVACRLAVSRRRLAAQNELLRESETRLPGLFDGAPAGMAVLDRDGRIVTANAALAALARHPLDELVGASFLTFVDIRDRAYYAGRLLAAIEHGGTPPVERRFRAADGTEVWALVGLSRLPDRDGHAVVFVQDVTERRRMESELAEQNRRLEQADRLKDELISVVSHDLRTPLTSIMGYLELALEEGDEGELSAERRDFLLVAQRNSKRLYRLVEDLLFLSRAQAGRASLELSPVDVDRVVRDVADASLPIAAAAGIELTYAALDARTLVADEHRLAEAVENLVSNALKFTHEGGHVEVRVVGGEDEVAVRVRDSGPGIAADDQQRLFDRFFRAPAAEGLPGSGLGLSIVEAIVEAHGGTISVESRPGEGSTFELRFPRSGPVPAASLASRVA